MVTNGFTVLEQTATTYVVGLVSRGRRGSRLITETRVAATEKRALLGFRLYWVVVGPFSKLIRRRWLRALATHPSRKGSP
jgi:hypothetical protein